MKRLVLIAMVVLMSSSIATAQDFCKGDFDYDANVDADDVTVFLAHFGRSPFNNPCPPDGPSPVPQTGQTRCWGEDGVEILCAGTGHDGDLQRGVALVTPRFTDNGDGTVTDNQAGLIWLKNANCFGNMTWDNSLLAANTLSNGSCELTDGSSAGDWRLPNYKELFSLVDTENYNPALPTGHPFNNVQPHYYWSSTSYASRTTNAWLVTMGSGYVSDGAKFLTFYVWPVRGGH